MTIKDSLYVSIPIDKQFAAENFLSRQTGPKMALFRKNWVETLAFIFKTPQMYSLA